MTAMTTAMREAGMTLPPQNKRIWLWLKDHPNKTTQEISSALALSLGNVSSLVSIMQKRGMVSANYEPSRLKHGTVARYSVVGTEFELLPMPKAKPTPAPTPAPVAAPTPNNVRKDEVLATAEQILEKLSVKQAHELYIALHGMFGGAK